MGFVIATEIVRLFDGSASLKKRQYRSVAVPRNAPAQALLEAALRTFHISDDPKDYYLTETSENAGEGEKGTKQRRVDG